MANSIEGSLKKKERKEERGGGRMEGREKRKRNYHNTTIPLLGYVLEENEITIKKMYAPHVYCSIT